MRTRDEHLLWAKERARQYLPADPVKAMTSMMSDIGKHPELAGHVGLARAPMVYGAHKAPDEVRKWIDDLN